MRSAHHVSVSHQAGRASVCDEVLLYLERHPHAADSLEGIMQWWLPRQRYETERHKIEQALERLVKRRLIVMHRLIDGTVVYAYAPGKRSRDDGVP